MRILPLISGLGALGGVAFAASSPSVFVLRRCTYVEQAPTAGFAIVEDDRRPAPRWHQVRDSLAFTVEWNAAFHTYELLWRNGHATTQEFTFVVDSGASSFVRPSRRALLGEEQERLPGHSVTPSHAGVVCVAVRDE